MTRNFGRTLGIAMAALVALNACGGGDDPTPPGPTGSIQVAVTPSALSLQQGASGSMSIALTRGGGFSAPVSLAISGLPAGLTAVATPDQLTGSTLSANVAVAVGAAVAAGTYTGTVRATATGVSDATATFGVTVTAAPAYTLTLTPATLSVVQGASGNATVALARTSFTAGVTLALLNPPAGITGTFNPAVATGDNSALTIAVANTVAPGSYTLTVQGTATGLTARTAALALTVTAPPGSIAMALAPTSLAIQQGNSGTATATLTRTNFTGNVTLAAAGAPAGATVSFSPNGTAGNTSTVTVAVGASTAVGTYPIALTASGSGVTNATATLSLTVSAPPAGGSAEWQFCSSSDLPIFFAVQDGGGAWQRVTPTTAGSVTKFSFNISSSRGGIAYITQHNSALVAPDVSATVSRNRVTRARTMINAARKSAERPTTYTRSTFATTYQTAVIYGLASELTTLGTDQCDDTQPTKTITGAVAGLGLGQFATVSLGGAAATAVGGGSTALTFNGVRFGTVDLIGTRSSVGSAPDKGVIVRNLNIANNGTLPAPVDFNAASAFTPASGIATITNSLGDELILASQIITANGESGTFALEINQSTSTTRTWYGLPASVATSGDLHAMFLIATPPGSNTADSRFQFQYVGSSVSNQSLTLGPRLTDPTISQVAAGAYPRFRFQGALPAEYRQAVQFDIQNSQGGSNDISISVTGGYLAAAGSASSYDISMPDLASVSGFPAASRLTAGAGEATTFAYGWVGQGILAPRPRAGDLLRAATRSSNVTVPN